MKEVCYSCVSICRQKEMIVSQLQKLCNEFEVETDKERLSMGIAVPYNYAYQLVYHVCAIICHSSRESETFSRSNCNNVFHGCSNRAHILHMASIKGHHLIT